MPDKQGNPLPPLPDEALDGEKYTTELKEIKCHHDPILIDSVTLKCSKCSAGWFGPGINRLYEEMRRQKGL